MTLSSSLNRTSRKQYQIFFWGGRLFFLFSSIAFLLFVWVLFSHWFIAKNMYRVQNASSILNEHIFWHVKIQQDISRLYIRDFMIEINKGSDTQQDSVVSSYVRYGSPPARNIVPKKVPMPEEYFVEKVKEFSSHYSSEEFSNALDRWQQTLKLLLDDKRWIFIFDSTTNSSSARLYPYYSQSPAIKKVKYDPSVLAFWQARYDAVYHWRVGLAISNDGVNARQLFLLRDWISDKALSELMTLRFSMETTRSELYGKWRYRHFQLFVSLFFLILFSLSFCILWWKRQGGQTLFEGPNAYFTDRLTGLFNRDHFNAIGTKLLKESQEKGFLLSVVTIQINQFKQLNDVYGFSIGDKVLHFLSKKVRENLRATDQLSRVGGGEFAILLPKSSKEGVKLFAQRLRKSLERLSVVGNYGETVKFTVQVNEEACLSEDISISETLQRAITIV